MSLLVTIGLHGSRSQRTFVITPSRFAKRIALVVVATQHANEICMHKLESIYLHISFLLHFHAMTYWVICHDLGA